MLVINKCRYERHHPWIASTWYYFFWCVFLKYTFVTSVEYNMTNCNQINIYYLPIVYVFCSEHLFKYLCIYQYYLSKKKWQVFWYNSSYPFCKKIQDVNKQVDKRETHSNQNKRPIKYLVIVLHLLLYIMYSFLTSFIIWISFQTHILHFYWFVIAFACFFIIISIFRRLVSLK